MKIEKSDFKKLLEEGVQCPVMGEFLYKLYRVVNGSFRKGIFKLIWRTEGNDFYRSVTIRRIFATYHDIDVGMYSHGGCFVPGAVDRETTIGRYCSIANPASVLNANHPLDRITTHAFTFNPAMRITEKYVISRIPLDIGNDVWLGRHSIILPNTRIIGDGAVVGAGAVVNKNIPPYAIVVGNPARIVRYRFPKEIRNELLESRWWEKSLEEIKPFLQTYQQSYSVPLEDVKR